MLELRKKHGGTLEARIWIENGEEAVCVAVSYDGRPIENLRITQTSWRKVRWCIRDLAGTLRLNSASTVILMDAVFKKFTEWVYVLGTGPDASHAWQGSRHARRRMPDMPI